MSERAEAWRAAGAAVAELAAKTCTDEQGAVHWPTVAAALGALTGEAALIACERDLPADGPVISQKALALFYDESGSPATLSGYLRQAMIHGMGLPAAAAPDPVHALRRVGASVGAKPFPPLPPDPAHWPLFWPLNAGPRLRREAHAAMASHGLRRGEAMFALTGALIVAILRGREVLPPTAAAAIGLEAMVAALRWAPRVEASPMEDLAYRPSGAEAAAPNLAPKLLPNDQLWSGFDRSGDEVALRDAELANLARLAEEGAEAAEGQTGEPPRRAFGRRRT